MHKQGCLVHIRHRESSANYKLVMAMQSSYLGTSLHVPSEAKPQLWQPKQNGQGLSLSSPSFGLPLQHSLPRGLHHSAHQHAQITRPAALGVAIGISFDQKVTLKGTIVVYKKNLLDLTDAAADAEDDALDLLGQKVTLQLISETLDPATGDGKKTDRIPVKWFTSKDQLVNGAIRYNIDFSVGKDFGSPGAVLVRNAHLNQFYLESFRLELPDKSSIFFSCNSWVYNYKKYSADRVFFSNKVYLPSETPAGLVKLRQSELANLRGNGTGERQEWDRIYDYTTYNDLGNPDLDQDLQRPILGGPALPYPRRCRTGRHPTLRDPTAESAILLSLVVDPYLPRDEVFSRVKNSSFLGRSLKSVGHDIVPAVEALFAGRANFKNFAEVKSFFNNGIDLGSTLQNIISNITKQNPLTLISELSVSQQTNPSLLQFPKPQIIQADEEAWMSDTEFARETLAGVNSMIIQLLKEFPPRSNLDPNVYGPQISSITTELIEDQLDGYKPAEAVKAKKLFVLDYHDVLLPYISKFNKLKDTKAYASRTLFFLTQEGTLKPIAIELSLPPSETSGQANRVFVPPKSGERDWLWELAKAYVATNDSGIHQLVSHWLRTHACIEPFIIATHRQLSALHPINLLLLPHFKNTMSINAKARGNLINAGGIIEKTFTPGRYSMEVSAVVYDKLWRFDEQGLPSDLNARGMAEYDETAKHGLKLAIEDYPYAVDGLEIWSALKQWVDEYIAIFYKDDKAVSSDEELQKWWTESRTVGHADKKDETWWPILNNMKNLSETLTTIIWVASAHHAAVNFGQYPYEGFTPNHPSRTHKLIPEIGSQEHNELLKDPERYYLSCVTNKIESAIVMTVIEILSTHAVEEVYLGQPLTENWTSNAKVLEAFNQFGKRIKDIENIITERNNESRNVNRQGPAKVPYTLLYPSSENGLTGTGVPTSISI